MIKIALDAMGNDAGPEVIAQGANLAVNVFEDIEIQIFGDKAQIQPHIINSERIKITHTEEYITNEDEPVRGIRRKREASIVLAAKSVKNGENDVVISSGSTGAALAAGLLLIGRIKGIDRPGLMPILPTFSGETKHLLLMDGGANVDLRPNHLKQFAILANFYAKNVLKIEQPRVGILSNGEEEGKGNKLVGQATDLLNELEELHFIGNVEPNAALAGETDILVADGFTGNIFLKTVESMASGLMKMVKTTLKEGPLQAKLGGALIKNTLKKSIDELKIDEVGGAILLGVKAPVIVSHGSADSQAIFHAIRQAREIQNSQVVPQIIDYFNEQSK